jgi:hypothetical protein
MDHNEKRSHSVPAGTFTDRNPPVPMDPDPSSAGIPSAPAIHVQGVHSSAPAKPISQSVSQPDPVDLDVSEVREDTLPGFAMEPLIPRQRVRTLLGVPALGGSSAETDPTAAYRLSGVARGHEEKISLAIAEVLDVLHQDDSASEGSELDAGFDDGFDASTLVSSTRDARESDEPGPGYDEETVEDGSQRLTFMELELIDTADENAHAAAAPRTPPPPPPTTSAGGTGANAASAATAAIVPDDSLAGFGEASVPAVIDIAPVPRRAGLGEPIALQAVSSLDELGAEIGQRHGAAGESAGRGSQTSVPPLTPINSDVAPRRGAHRPVVLPDPSASPAQHLQLDGSARLGLLSVAAVMLAATGVWFLTGGTFRRASDLGPVAAAHPAASAAKTTPPSVPDAPKPTSTLKAPESKDATETTRAPATDPGQARAMVPVEHANPKSSSSASSRPKPAAAPALALATADHAADATPASKPVAANRHGVHATQSQAQRAKPKPEGVQTTAPAAVGQLPDQPSRSDVLNRLESVRSTVRACAAGRSGVADLDITIANTGLVMHVLVGGDFAGTTEGSCIARAVRGARFPTFKQDRFRLLFPYAI